ncbi:hypothetical protein PSPO01_14737 [Paraphaeosphaeria sporulosa]
MPSVIYHVDPFADTVIDETLRLSDTDFAELEEEHQRIHTQPSKDEWTKLSKKEKKARKRTRASSNSAGRSIPKDNGGRAEPSYGAFSREQGLVHDPEPASTVDGGVENSNVELAEPAFEPTNSEDDEIHYLVSSRHLIFSNAIVQLEQAFPFSNQTTLLLGYLPDSNVVMTASLFGFAGALSKLAQAYVMSFLKAVDSSTKSGGLMAMFDLKNEFASSWSRLANAAGLSG